jgi:hypothetical protein
VIGNYHSHPQQQAEFRQRRIDEREVIATVGISLI